MRSFKLIPIVAACVLGACRDTTPKSSDANAAEVSTPSPETPGVARPPAVATGPVAFADAQTAFKEKRYDEAARLFATYSTAQPDNIWGYYMLGLSAWKQGDRDRAVEAFKQALEKDSTHAKSHLNLSRVLIEQDKAQDALPHVQAALRVDSTSSQAFRLLGRVKGELGDTGAAIAAYQRSIVLDGSDVWSMNNLARVYIGQRQFERALGPLARAIEIDSSVAAFQNNLGLALEHSGHVTQAADAYRAARGIDSAYQRAAVNLTRVEGLKQDPTVVPVDLAGVARSFVEQVKSRR